MAISDDLPGVTTSVQIHGQALPEYRDDDIQDPERTVSYMIEAMPDQIFEIHARASPHAAFSGSSLAIHFYVDGKYVDGTLIDAADISTHGSSARSRGRYVTSSLLRRYQFASRERQIEIGRELAVELGSIYTDFVSQSSATVAPSAIVPVILDDLPTRQKFRTRATSLEPSHRPLLRRPVPGLMSSSKAVLELSQSHPLRSRSKARSTRHPPSRHEHLLRYNRLRI